MASYLTQVRRISGTKPVSKIITYLIRPFWRSALTVTTKCFICTHCCSFVQVFLSVWKLRECLLTFSPLFTRQMAFADWRWYRVAVAWRWKYFDCERHPRHVTSAARATTVLFLLFLPYCSPLPILTSFFFSFFFVTEPSDFSWNSKITQWFDNVTCAIVSYQLKSKMHRLHIR